MPNNSQLQAGAGEGGCAAGDWRRHGVLGWWSQKASCCAVGQSNPQLWHALVVAKLNIFVIVHSVKAKRVVKRAQRRAVGAGALGGAQQRQGERQ